MPTTEGAETIASGTTPISVEVIYARPEQIWRQTMQLPAASTVHDALTLSRFFEDFPGSTAATIDVGIYGQRCALDRILQHNERVEIYRPLVFDPMESRRRRAHHRQRNKQ